MRPSGTGNIGFAYAKSGCSGVGGVAEWRKYAMQIFEMELHHRGSKWANALPASPASFPPVISQKRFSLSSEDRSRRCVRYGQLPSLHKALYAMYPSPQGAEFLLSVFQNRIESRPIRRRSLPDTGRLRWRFSIFCASLFPALYPPPGSHYPPPTVR